MDVGSNGNGGVQAALSHKFDEHFWFTMYTNIKMALQWRVNTVRVDGALIDSEIFTSFYDAWAYSQVELVGIGWRMFSRKTALEHFYEQNPLPDQPGVVRPNCPPFKVAWRDDLQRCVSICII